MIRKIQNANLAMTISKIPFLQGNMHVGLCVSVEFKTSRPWHKTRELYLKKKNIVSALMAFVLCTETDDLDFIFVCFHLPLSLQS